MKLTLATNDGEVIETWNLVNMFTPTEQMEWQDFYWHELATPKTRDYYASDLGNQIGEALERHVKNPENTIYCGKCKWSGLKDEMMNRYSVYKDEKDVLYKVCPDCGVPLDADPFAY